jgi:SAM-dependent methyltransferase
MRESIRELAGIIAETLPVAEPIYEFGALQVLHYGKYADLRPFFPGKQYVGCDMREGPGVDKVLDLHKIDLPDETAGTVLAFDTLEHVEYPHKAMAEVHRVVKPGGMAVISSVMNFPIHGHPSDYWRFTPEAFRSLLKPFDYCYVESAGEEDFPHTVIGIGFKGEGRPTDEFVRRIADWKRRWFFVHGRSWRQIRRHCTPPILRGFGRQIRRYLR